MKIFSGSSNKLLTENVAKVLGQPVSPIEIFIFPDGEQRIRLLDSVVGEDAVLIQPTASPVDINYMELFFIANALIRNGAKSIKAVIPYLGYQRQHHLFREGEAVSLEVIVKTLEAVGIGHVVTFDLHAPKIPEIFTVPLSHLSAAPLFINVIKQNKWDAKDSVLVSPDRGGVYRNKNLSEILNLPYVTIKKERDLVSGKVEAVDVIGDVAKRALVVDDMISSGATLIKAAELLKAKGAEEIIVFATHGILAKDASRLLQESSISKIFLTDTVMIPEEKRFEKLEILSVAEMVADELRKFSI